MSGGFHSRLMMQATKDFKEILDTYNIDDPEIPVISNYNGLPYKYAEGIRKHLPINFSRSLNLQKVFHVIFERQAGSSFPMTYHCGPGTYLLDILSKVNLKAYKSSQSVPV